jgi:hypothetical protein
VTVGVLVDVGVYQVPVGVAEEIVMTAPVTGMVPPKIVGWPQLFLPVMLKTLVTDAW